MSSRFVHVGPAGNNECCVCGFYHLDSGCSGVCDRANTWLYGNREGDPPQSRGGAGEEVPCVAPSCCPCPDMEPDRKVLLTLTVDCGDDSFLEEICLLAGAGISICSGDNPTYSSESSTVQCYDPAPYPGPEDGFFITGQHIEYEKYGKSGHIFTGGDPPPCLGAKADISLCCCSEYGSTAKAGSSGECHTCNYVLTLQFKPVNGTDYCHCPGVEEEQILPGYINASPGNGGPTHFNEFKLITSSCDPLYLEYEARELYWNCGPCLNGSESHHNTVTLHATIVSGCP